MNEIIKNIFKLGMQIAIFMFLLSVLILGSIGVFKAILGV